MKLGKTACVSLGSILGLVAGACGFPGNDGYYLEEGADTDLGVRIETVYVGFIPSMQITGNIFEFPAGAPYPTTTLNLSGAYAVDQSFTGQVIDPADPGTTGTLAGNVIDLDGDALADRMTIEIDMGGDFRLGTLDKVPAIAYDPYKCWDGPGSCERGIGELALSDFEYTGVDPHGGLSWNFVATMLYKDLNGSSPGSGWIGRRCGGTSRTSVPLPGSSPLQGVTTTITGVTEGEITFEVQDWWIVGGVDSGPCDILFAAADSNDVFWTFDFECGDGAVQEPPELCDEAGGNSNAPNAACRANCTPRRCADSIIDDAFGEQCDDGNQFSGDGCSASCQSEGSERGAFARTGRTIFD